MPATRVTRETSPTSPARAHRSVRIGAVDGLRGLALILVVAFHLFGDGRVSGGVDVFLLLSGYFATGALLRRAEDGTLRLTAHYARTLARLLPAALVVLAAVTVALLTLAPRLRWSSVLREIGASATFWQNWELIHASLAYGAAGPGASPLQHFWSLSVQGQFFTVWPLVVLGLTACARKLAGHWFGRGALSPAVLLTAVTAIATAASFAGALRLVAVDQPVAYLSTFTRFWEIGAGALLALALRSGVRLPSLVRRRDLLGWAGLGLVVGSGFLVDGSQVFPGAWALVPVGGAALVLVATAPGAAVPSAAVPGATAPGSTSPGSTSPASGRGVERLLDSAPLRLGARVSYALYLWHWPVLVFWLLTTDTHRAGPLAAAGILTISAVLAWLTTRYVAEPILSRVTARLAARQAAAESVSAATMGTASMGTATTSPVTMSPAYAGPTDATRTGRVGAGATSAGTAGTADPARSPARSSNIPSSNIPSTNVTANNTLSNSTPAGPTPFDPTPYGDAVPWSGSAAVARPARAPSGRRTLAVLAGAAVLVLGGAQAAATAHDATVRSNVAELLTPSPDHPGAAALAPDTPDTPDAPDAPDAQLATAYDVPFRPATWVAYDDHPDRPDCAQRGDEAAVLECTVVAPEEPTAVVYLAGASHEQQYEEAFAALARKHGWELRELLKHGCRLATSGEDWMAHTPTCATWNEQALRTLIAARPDAVVVVGTRTYEDGSPEEVLPGQVDAWRALDDAGIQVVTIRDNPRFEWFVPECLDATTSPEACGRPRAEQLAGVSPVTTAPGVPDGVVHLDLTDSICGPETCAAVVGNVLVYRDDDHLTNTYVRTLTPVVGRQLRSGAPWLFGDGKAAGHR